MTEIESAVASRDAEKIARAAHTLKGALRNMCAISCAEAASQLEMTGKAGDFDGAGQSLDTLRHEFQHLQSVLTEVAEGVWKVLSLRTKLFRADSSSPLGTRWGYEVGACDGLEASRFCTAPIRRNWPLD
jgi:HPt (histidine-containing phosphotransfer) domain-containing protein